MIDVFIFAHNHEHLLTRACVSGLALNAPIATSDRKTGSTRIMKKQTYHTDRLDIAS